VPEETRLAPIDKKKAEIVTLFKRNERRFTEIAPKGFHGARLAQIAMTNILQTPGLIECTRESLFAGVVESMKLGLSLGGPAQECWLIPYRVKGAMTANLIIGYQGMRSLVDRSGTVRDLHPRAVHNGRYPVTVEDRVEWQQTGEPDHFEVVFGSNPRIVHIPRNPKPEHKQQLVGCYAVARLKGGGEQMEWLELDEIERHRNRSRAKDSGPWVTDYVQMALKTSVRVICKYLPKSAVPYGVQYALYVEDIQERGDGLSLDPNDKIDIVDVDAKPIGELNAATRTDDLRARIEQQGAKVPAAAANTDHLKPATDVNDSDVRW
jgi:recombination protein RecT